MRYDLRGDEDIVETLKNLASAAHMRFVWFEDDPDETRVLNDPLARRLFDIGRQMEQGLHRFEFVEDLNTFPTKEDLVRHVEEGYAFARSSLEELGRVGSEQLADVPERLRDHVRYLLERVTTLMRQALVLGDMVHDLRRKTAGGTGKPTNAEGAVPEFIPSTYRHLEDDLKHFHDDDRFDRSVFVMMKFPDPAHMEAWQVACLEDLYGAVKEELDRHGLVARRADKKTYAASKQLWDNLSIYMLGCRYGVAILEDHVGDELNPNVALEYGFMKGLGREVILLKERRFKHLRADLVGTIPKEFDIATDHAVDRRSLQDAVSNWLTDIGVPPKHSR